MNFDKREGRVDINMTDICTGNTTFTGDGSDNRTGLDAVLLADFDALARTSSDCVSR